MMITQALELAESEHVVQFLLCAYVETLMYYESTRSFFPAEVRTLPLSGKRDVEERLRVLRALLGRALRPDFRCMIEEAIEVFTIASRRLNVLAALATISGLRRTALARVRPVSAAAAVHMRPGALSHAACTRRKSL